MIDEQNLYILIQLIDNMLNATGKMEDAYDDKNSKNFEKYKTEILDSQKKLSEILGQNVYWWIKGQFIPNEGYL